MAGEAVLTLADLERIQAQALSQAGWEIQTCIAMTRSEAAELCRLARIGMALETAEEGE